MKASTTRPNSHFGNAERFLDEFAADLGYVKQFGRWYVWDETRYTPDQSNLVGAMAKFIVRGIPHAALGIADDEQRRAAIRWALRCEDSAAIKQILELASFDQKIAILPQAWDSNPDILNVLNGVVDLRTGRLREHDRADKITRLAAVRYDPSARCPRWESFLAQVQPNPDVRTMLRLAVGYSLTGHTREQCLFLLLGVGRNGKSVLLETLRKLFGDYAAQADFETFLDQGNAGGSGA